MRPIIPLIRGKIARSRLSMIVTSRFLSIYFSHSMYGIIHLSNCVMRTCNSAFYRTMSGSISMSSTKTRWSSIYPAMEKIAAQYDPLKKYLRDKYRRHPESYIASILSGCFEDLILKAEFFFWCYVLKSVQQTDMSFQSNNDSFSLLNDLKRLIADLGKIIINHTAKKKSKINFPRL